MIMLIYSGVTTISTGVWYDDFLIRNTNNGAGWYSSLSVYSHLHSICNTCIYAMIHSEGLLLMDEIHSSAENGDLHGWWSIMQTMNNLIETSMSSIDDIDQFQVTITFNAYLMRIYNIIIEDPLRLMV